MITTELHKYPTNLHWGNRLKIITRHFFSGHFHCPNLNLLLLNIFLQSFVVHCPLFCSKCSLFFCVENLCQKGTKLRFELWNLMKWLRNFKQRDWYDDTAPQHNEGGYSTRLPQVAVRSQKTKQTLAGNLLSQNWTQRNHHATNNYHLHQLFYGFTLWFIFCELLVGKCLISGRQTLSFQLDWNRCSGVRMCSCETSLACNSSKFAFIRLRYPLRNSLWT